MTIRTSRKTVTFKRPFVLGGLDETLPAGAYSVETDEELLEGISFPAYRRTRTVVHLHARPGHPGLTRALTIDPNELDAALERDAAPVEIPVRPVAGQETPKEQRPPAMANHSRVLSLLIFALLAAAPGLALAQSGATEMPQNARAISYGSGWECDPGFRELDGACAAVKAPANAYPTDTSYGRGWECDHGYREGDETCIAVAVPANAYLDPSGEGWECDRGYRKLDAACVAIKVPAHGYLADSTYGSGWQCDRGYRALGDDCLAVEVPANAYFVESSFGSGWQCERGFREAGGACVAVELPKHAHLDYSGNDWECDRPFQKHQDGCVRP